jgi:hypothetical protein
MVKNGLFPFMKEKADEVLKVAPGRVLDEIADKVVEEVKERQ